MLYYNTSYSWYSDLFFNHKVAYDGIYAWYMRPRKHRDEKVVTMTNLQSLAALDVVADFCSRDNFWTTFRISFIFGRINDPDL